MSKIMALDIGFRATGIAVFDVMRPALSTRVDRLIDLRCIRPKEPTKKRGLRQANLDAEAIALMTRGIYTAITDNVVSRILVELPDGGSRSNRAAKTMGAAAAMIVTLAEILNLAVEHYTPRDTRIAGAGSPEASKDDVIAAMGREWPELFDKFPNKADHEHVADALATWKAGRNGNLARL